MPETILEIKDVECDKAPGQPIFSHASFEVNESDVVVLQGKSGSGCVHCAAYVLYLADECWVWDRKTTLLKCLAHLNVYRGEIAYRGRCVVV